MNDTMIGLDIGKSVFQVHAEDSAGTVVLQKRLRRGQVEAFFAKLPPARIGIEACGSAHHWGRTLRVQGHEVRLIPAAYVKPFVRRNNQRIGEKIPVIPAADRYVPRTRDARKRGMGRGPLQGVDRHSRRLIGRRAGGGEEAPLPPRRNVFGAHRAVSGSARPAPSSASSGG